ncbi:MAG: serine/threonine protein kinase, partial [bacterium]
RDKELVVKVVDFGIAKEKKNEDQSKVLTAVGTIVGTPYYMAPEQGMTGEVDVRSDIYSLGAIAFEALTGQRVFDAPLAMSVIVKKITEDPPTVKSIRPEISQEVDDVVLRAINKDPANRFSSANEFAVELAMAAFKNTPPTYHVTTAKLAMPKPQLATMLKRETSVSNSPNSDLERPKIDSNIDSNNVLEQALASSEKAESSFQKISSSIMDNTIEVLTATATEISSKTAKKVLVEPQNTEKKPKLLVIINSPTIILVISRYMQRLGYDVQAITNGKTALSAIVAEELSAIILSLELPGLSGEDLCKMIKTDPSLSAASDVPVFLFSSLDEEELKKKTSTCQADGYIHKTWKMDKVADIIQKAIIEKPVVK